MSSSQEPLDFQSEYNRKYTARDLAASPFFARQFQRLHRIFLPGTPRPRVLDLGGGTGQYSKILQGCGFEVVLMDISDVTVRKARSLGILNAECVDFRVCEDSYGRFDIILSKGFSLLNTTDLEVFEQTLRQMEAMLAPEGVILFWSESDLSDAWSPGRFYHFKTSTIRPFFDKLYLFPALRYQLWMPEWSIALLSGLISMLPFRLPRPITLIGVRGVRA